MIQHAGDGQYGPFNATQAPELLRTIGRNITENTRAINLLGCEVPRSFAVDVQNMLQGNGFNNVQVNVLVDAFIHHSNGGQWLFEINWFQSTFSITHESAWVNIAQGVAHFISENGERLVNNVPISELGNYLTNPLNLHRM